MRGGGGRTLAWITRIGYVLLWAWIELTLLVAGAWIAASVIATALVALWRIPTLAPHRPYLLAGTAAIMGGACWVTGPLLEAAGYGGELSGAGSVAAALLFLPALLGIRKIEAAAVPSVGIAGLVFGFILVFAGALLAGGLLAPVSGSYAASSVWTGRMMLLAGSVPFAVVAVWTKATDVTSAIALVMGVGGQFFVGALDPVAMRTPASLVAVVYGLGWAGVGFSLVSRREGPGIEARAQLQEGSR